MIGEPGGRGEQKTGRIGEVCVCVCDLIEGWEEGTAALVIKPLLIYLR